MKINRLAQKQKVIFIAIFLVLLCVCMVITIIVNIPKEQLKFITFNDIDDMHMLDEYSTGGKIAKDTKLKDVFPLQSYCNNIEYDGERFTVRAYVFSTYDEAAKYYKTTASFGKIMKNAHGHASGGMGEADYITLENTKIIIITGRNLSVIQRLTKYMLTEGSQSFRPISKDDVAQP